MIETFRMLGREREADLAREADRRRLAAALPRRRRRLRTERLLGRSEQPAGALDALELVDAAIVERQS